MHRSRKAYLGSKMDVFDVMLELIAEIAPGAPIVDCTDEVELITEVEP